MKETEINKLAWGKLSQDHFNRFLKELSDGRKKLNPLVEEQLGDLSGRKVLHLQCNTGADSVLLAKLGAKVTAVDFVLDNINFAIELAKANHVDIDFICSDVHTLDEILNDSFDLVITFDGVLGWLFDLSKWASNIYKFLKPQGKLFVHDGHPFYLVFDEQLIKDGILSVKYPYFNTELEVDLSIGGYASEAKEALNYFRSHKISDIINALADAQLFITKFIEFDRCDEGMGGDTKDDRGLMYCRHFEGKLPLGYSLWATRR
ncbi:MAG: class I SAM-dependent methyltransferase [Firmicutes bacterium HGW-Firmicutes-19]|jgi:SAM-dependent methyltransferase|nr:MAG: class I SAM-dependent methyltransferase [Firmicutes bacterium HGW-Firmicutes-19]